MKDIHKDADVKYLKQWLDIFYISYRYFLTTMKFPEHKTDKAQEAQQAIEIIEKILDEWQNNER